MQTAQQRQKPEFGASSAYASGTGTASRAQLAKPLPMHYMHREEPPQAARRPPSSYIPVVVHKDRQVEPMISYLEPTEEQAA